MPSSDKITIPTDQSTPSSYLPRMAKGAGINLSGAFMRTVILYVYTLALARFLSPADLGQYFLMFTIINILCIVSVAGLDMGIVRYVASYAGENNYRFVRRTLKTGVAMGLPLSAAVAVIVAVLHLVTDSSPVFQLLILAPLLLIIYVNIIFLVGFNDQDKDVIRLVKNRLGLASGA